MVVYTCISSTEEEMQEVHKLEAYLGSLSQEKDGKARLKEKREGKK